MSRKRRLGRGLEALLGVGNSPDSDSAATPPASDSGLTDNSGSPTRDTNNGPDPEDVRVAGREYEQQIKSEDRDEQSEAPGASTKRENGTAADGPTILSFPGRASESVSGLSAKAASAGNDSGSTAKAVESKPSKTSPTRLENTVPPGGGFGPGADQNADAEHSNTVQLNVYDVDDNPFQPRREFNRAEIESLAESLKTHDQLQPILVRKVGERYQLISGERRLRAAIHAGWSKIGAQIREADDRLVAELAIVENLQRKDLNPVEKALSFRRYLDEHKCSQEELAGRLKIDRSTVANLLRLLELPPAVQKSLQVGLISNGHARALLPLGDEHLQIEFCNRVQREGLSVRAIEHLVRDRIDEEDGVRKKSGGKARTKSSQVTSLESELRNSLGTRVEIKPSSRGRGKIVVHYNSREEFERLREILNGAPRASQHSRDVA